MSASIVCTAERKRDVNYARNDLKQKLQYRAQCVKERQYSTTPINSCSHARYYMHAVFNSKREREKERETDEMKRKSENANALRIDIHIDL